MLYNENTINQLLLTNCAMRNATLKISVYLLYIYAYI